MGLTGPQYDEQTMHVCRMNRLELVILARVGKWSS